MTELTTNRAVEDAAMQTVLDSERSWACCGGHAGKGSRVDIEGERLIEVKA